MNEGQRVAALLHLQVLVGVLDACLQSGVVGQQPGVFQKHVGSLAVTPAIGVLEEIAEQHDIRFGAYLRMRGTDDVDLESLPGLGETPRIP